MPSLAAYLGKALEQRASLEVLPPIAHLDGIVVLGGSTTRVAAAMTLAQTYPNALLVLSGPGQAEVDLALSDPRISGRVRIDSRARTTYENAWFSRDLLKLQKDDCWVVVTSAVHMPRAIGAFTALNVPIFPWPVRDTPATPAELSAWVWHEVLGLLYYRILGRSSSIAPRAQHSNHACSSPMRRPT